MKTKRFKAFTLIELLVVIAVVGILSGLVFVSMSGAIDAAKDTKRKTDLSAIQKALMMYQSSNGSYPILASCTIGPSCLETELASYIPNLPIDSDTTKHYTYSSNGTNFTLSATLSNGGVYSYNNISGWTTGLAGYVHYKVITITNSSGGVLTNYPIKLIVYQASGGGSGSNCEGLCQTDFTDIAFTDITGDTALPFWLETGSLVSNTNITVWVNVPTITTGSSTQIRMYYDSDSPTLASNGDNTFPTSQGMLFDDFSGVSLDAVKWATVGSPTVFDSVVSITSNENAYKTILSQDSFGIGMSIRSRIKSGHYTSNGEQYERYYALFQNGTNYIHAIFTHSLSSWQGKYIQGNGADSLTAIQGWVANTWKVIEGKRLAANITWTVNDANTIVHSTNYPTTSGQCGVGVYGIGNYATMSMDWVLVRKYVATEPTAAFGSQN